jgi:tetratricopeptide (TPR) repeat protein
LQARLAMSRADRDPAARALAIQGFERWLESAPDDLEALVALGQLHLAERRPARAAELLGRASAVRPGQPMIEGLLGRALADAGEAAKSEEVRRGLLRDHPERLEVRFELADILLRQGRMAEVEQLLSQAPADHLHSPELRRRRAAAQMLGGDIEAARATATELTTEFPENATLRILLASVEQADGEWERVIALVGPIAARPQSPESVLSMNVEALERLGRPDLALSLLDSRREALAKNGATEDAESVALLAAGLALRSGRLEEAERRAREIAASARPDAESAALRDANVAYLLAESAEERGDFRGAAEALVALDAKSTRARRYELAVRAGDAAVADALRRELAAAGPEAVVVLAEAELRLERYGEAVELFRRAVETDPNAVRPLFGLATSLERAQRPAESEQVFERLLAKHPEHAPSLNYLGYMWIEKARNLERAVEMVTRAVRSDPANAAYVDSLGWGFHQLGRSDEAVRLLERAARLEPGDATILEHLGDASVSAGDFESARRAYERALAVSEDASGLNAKIARLPRPGGAS